MRLRGVIRRRELSPTGGNKLFPKAKLLGTNLKL